MDNYKITIQYDGTRYKGWQKQTSTGETIQGKLSDILTKMTGEEVDVIGSGRTDAGVHALGQVASFHINTPAGMTEEDILLYMNKYLPADINVLSLKRASDRFHARYGAKTKTYMYRIHVSPISNVFEHKYVYTYLDNTLNVTAMRQAAEDLVGTHDFKAFCGNKKMKKSTVRHISSINIEEIHSNGRLTEIDITYTGNGFLQNMVRILTGTLIEVGIGKLSPSDMTKILDSLNRENAGFTAPACGLVLVEVNY